jgi:hypothetical protein
VSITRRTAIRRALDPDADLSPVVQERDPLHTEDDAQTLGQGTRARSLRHDDSHLHLDPPQGASGAAQQLGRLKPFDPFLEGVIFATPIRTTIALRAKPMVLARSTSIAGNGPEHHGQHEGSPNGSSPVRFRASRPGRRGCDAATFASSTVKFSASSSSLRSRRTLYPERRSPWVTAVKRAIEHPAL